MNLKNVLLMLMVYVLKGTYSRVTNTRVLSKVDSLQRDQHTIHNLPSDEQRALQTLDTVRYRLKAPHTFGPSASSNSKALHNVDSTHSEHFGRSSRQFQQESENRPGYIPRRSDVRSSEEEESRNILQEDNVLHGDNDIETDRVTNSRLNFHNSREPTVGDSIQEDETQHQDSTENDVLPKHRLTVEDIKNVIRSYITRPQQCVIGDVSFRDEECVNFYYHYLVWYKSRHPDHPDGELTNWEKTVYALLD